jgi:hypothetical protein
MFLAPPNRIAPNSGRRTVISKADDDDQWLALEKFFTWATQAESAGIAPPLPGDRTSENLSGS